MEAEACMPEKSVWVRWTIDHVKEWVRGNLPSLMSQREGPKDYAEDEEDLRNLVRLAVRAGGQHYHEGNGEKRLLTWLLVVTGSLTVSAIIGGVAIYGKVSAIETGMNAHEQRIDRLERANERRYRGADAAP
jgi:hypothetical protein